MVQIREAVLTDIPAIFAVRTAVKENSATMQRLAEIGITPISVAEALQSHCKGWVADDDGPSPLPTRLLNRFGQCLSCLVLNLADLAGH